VLVRPFRHLVSLLRRGDVLPGPADDASELTRRSTLHDIAEAVPGLREELVDRARAAGLLVGWVGLLGMPAWNIVDRISAPEVADRFLLVRLLCDVPILLVLLVLWRHPLGARRPEALTFAVLAIIQVEIAWMITQADDPRYHLLGFTLAIYGSGCILVARPRWTAALVGISWAALAVTLLTPARLAPDQLVAVTVYLGTASVIAMLAHLRRYALHNRELLTRVRLEREQERAQSLLEQLQRLSQEDPLTGLANRRRWDGALSEACTHARQHGGDVAVLLVDLDHFKQVNDRHGHAGGDGALQHVAALLCGGVRGADLVARLGGDELAVLLPGADLDRATELAERLRRDVHARQPAGFAPGELTVTVGVAAATGAVAYPMELMSQADAQLYRAKITRNAVGSPLRREPARS
jgi:diguanylate cyclase (GGDEF)-like protein